MKQTFIIVVFALVCVASPLLADEATIILVSMKK